MSNKTTAKSTPAASTTPPGPPRRQNTGVSTLARHNLELHAEKGTAGDGRHYSGGHGCEGGQQSPYMDMLLSLDKIPRLHNILVTFFTWLLLVGFVLLPGSFTSAERRQEGDIVEIPVGVTEKISLTPANTAALVVGSLCILAGAFGSAWLALRWRRNYVWLLNKLYMPLILNALAGVVAAVTGVYAQQAGEWSPQAVAAAVVELSVLGLSMVLFFVYNYWLLKRLRSDHEEKSRGAVGKGKGEEKQKRSRREEERAGLFARLRRARKKPPVAAGSVV